MFLMTIGIDKTFELRGEKLQHTFAVLSCSNPVLIDLPLGIRSDFRPFFMLHVSLPALGLPVPESYGLPLHQIYVSGFKSHPMLFISFFVIPLLKDSTSFVFFWRRVDASHILRILSSCRKTSLYSHREQEGF